MTELDKKNFKKRIEKAPKEVPYSWSINDLKCFIELETEKFIIQKCTKELGEGEILVVSVESLDMSGGPFGNPLITKVGLVITSNKKYQ